MVALRFFFFCGEVSKVLLGETDPLMRVGLFPELEPIEWENRVQRQEENTEECFFRGLTLGHSLGHLGRH